MEIKSFKDYIGENYSYLSESYVNFLHNDAYKMYSGTNVEEILTDFSIDNDANIEFQYFGSSDNIFNISIDIQYDFIWRNGVDIKNKKLKAAVDTVVGRAVKYWARNFKYGSKDPEFELYNGLVIDLEYNLYNDDGKFELIVSVIGESVRNEDSLLKIYSDLGESEYDFVERTLNMLF